MLFKNGARVSPQAHVSARRALLAVPKDEHVWEPSVVTYITALVKTSAEGERVQRTKKDIVVCTECKALLFAKIGQ